MRRDASNIRIGVCRLASRLSRSSVRILSSALRPSISALSVCSSSLEACSSSLAVCNSSLELSSSSLVDWASSLAERSSSMMDCRYRRVDVSSVSNWEIRPRESGGSSGFARYPSGEARPRLADRPRRRSGSAALISAVESGVTASAMVRGPPRETGMPSTRMPMFFCRASSSGRAHMQYHILAQHAEQTQIGFARVRGEVRPHVSAELDNAKIVVDHHGRRRVFGQQQTIHLLLQRAERSALPHLGFASERIFVLLEDRERGYAGGQLESMPVRRRFPGVNPVLAIERSKVLRQAPGSLRAAEQQTAVGLQCVEQRTR